MQTAEPLARPRRRALPGLAGALSWLAVALAALLPRLAGLGEYITNDEANFWLRRSDAFLRALQTGDFAATALSTHPGVTTTWLGSAGILLQRALRGTALLEGGFATRLALMQLPVALVNALAVLLGYALLRRMLPRSAAALGALLWALDPFVFGYSRLLHVDALATSFITLSILAACVAWHHDRRRRWVLASGVFAGLALLSKSPALVLVPAVGLLALRSDRRHEAQDAPPDWAARVWRLLSPVLLWGLACAATVFALWPALWVAPLRPFELVRLGVEAEGAQPHMLGNFFLGRADPAPGLLFYPVALALRLTPLTLLGLLLLPWAWHNGRSAHRRDLAALAALAVLLTVALSLFPKKFNRYLLPALPPVDILAAWGLIWAARSLASWRALLRPVAARALAGGLVLLVVAAQVAGAVRWSHHTLAYFNPLLGGAPVGANTFSAGWGEGLEQAAAWLNRQPNITGVLIASTNVPTLQPYLRQGAQSVTPDGAMPEQAGYVVIYLADTQGQPPFPPFDAYYNQRNPLYTVRLHGVEYAWIYQVPPQVAQPLPAQFGEAIDMRGFTRVAPAAAGQPLRYRLFWQAGAAPGAGAMLFAHLIGGDGQTYARADLPIGAEAWEAQRYYTTELAVPLPAELPAGCYTLATGLYKPDSGERLPLRAEQLADPALDGPDALALDQVCIN